MAESVSARAKAGATQRAPAAREPHREYAKAPSLSVRYWKRMRINKVYPVVVSWRGAGRDGEVEGGPVTVRLLMAGAQVVPAEHTMDPREPRNTATFYVTPLAHGGLRGEKIEVLQQGRKIQEIRLPSKTTSQSSTLVWLFLAIFFPWLIWHYFMFSPIGYEPYRTPTDLSIIEVKVSEKKTVKGKEETQVTYHKPWAGKSHKDNRYNKAQYDPDMGATLITQRIKESTANLKEIGLEDETVNEYYATAQSFPGDAYAYLFKQHSELDQPLAFYMMLIFLFMAFISFVARTEARRTTTAKPLPLGGAGD